MRSSGLLAIALVAAIAAQPTLAEERKGEMQAGPMAGFSRIKVDADRMVPGSRTSTDGVVLGGSFGYRTSKGVVLELGHTDTIHETVGGSNSELSLAQTYVAMGYEIDLGSQWYLTPKVGYEKWRLFSEDSRQFFDEDEPSGRAKSLSGDEPIFQIGVSHDVSSMLALGLTVTASGQDFGQSTTAAVTVKFGFGGK
jgi:hypothetical protein